MAEEINRFFEMLKSGDQAGLKQLLEAHPELANAKSEQGVSLLLLTAYFRNEPIKAILLESKSALDIFEAAACGQLSRVKELLDKNPELIQAYANDGFTPLGLAAFFGQEDIAKFLLHKGSDPNQVANNGMAVAPIHSAVAANNFPIVEALLQYGAAVNAKQMQGVTALHSAAHRNNQEIVQLLLTNGAQKDLKMEDGKTALDIAKEEGFEELASFITNFHT